MCSTCDCEGIQIPIGQQGAVGPQGPAGANGADGSNGTNGTNGTTVIHNSYTLRTSTTHDLWESLESIKINANTITTDGSAIYAEVLYERNTSTNTYPNTRLRFIGNISTVLIPSGCSALLGDSYTKVRIISKITRTSNTTAKFETKIYHMAGNTVVSIQDCPIGTITGLDFSTDYEVETSCYSVDNRDISQKVFFITKYIK